MKRFSQLGILLAVAFIVACDRPQEGPTEQPASSSAPQDKVVVKPRKALAESGPVAEGPRVAVASPPDALGKSVDGLGLSEGAEIPNGSGSYMDGRRTSPRELASEGPVLLIFYRGGWCPYCNFQVRELSKAADQFEERGITPVLVSVDRVGEAEKMASTYDIPFPVLSDSGLDLHRAFRVLNEVPAEMVDKLRSKGMDLEASSGKKHHTVAHPSVFILADGKVLFSHVDPDYQKRPTVAQLIDVLERKGFKKSR